MTLEQSLEAARKLVGPDYTLDSHNTVITAKALRDAWYLGYDEGYSTGQTDGYGTGYDDGYDVKGLEID